MMYNPRPDRFVTFHQGFERNRCEIEKAEMEKVEKEAEGRVMSVPHEMLKDWVTEDHGIKIAEDAEWTNKEIGLGLLAGIILLWTGWTAYNHFTNLEEDDSSSSEEE